jgi:hypothetical protein
MRFSVGCSELRVCGRRFRPTDYYFPSAKNEGRTERLCTTMTSIFLKQISTDIARNFSSWLEYFMSNFKPPAGDHVLPKLDGRLTHPNSLDVIIRTSKRNVILRITFPLLLLLGAELPSWKFWPSQRTLSISLDPGRRLSSF